MPKACPDIWDVQSFCLFMKPIEFKFQMPEVAIVKRLVRWTNCNNSIWNKLKCFYTDLLYIVVLSGLIYFVYYI